ncbi:Mitochondrial inner membrane protease subunit 1 [Nymphaea thermarum]|nr:Mitochondrial inner membrane protease subunit 1 [Nymphaea thermarum]
MGWRFLRGSGTLHVKELAKESWNHLTILTKSLCLVHVVATYVVSTEVTTGPSMLPTLSISGDILLVEHLSSRFGRIKVGDVVVATSPLNPQTRICKRVIGLEGDRISYHPNSLGIFATSVTVPKGHVWLQGDNSLRSQDSRHYGPVPFGLLQGRVWLRVWPLQGFGRLN